MNQFSDISQIANIAQILHFAYLGMLGIFILISAFIVFHIVSYSQSKIATMIMLLLFVPVLVIMLFTNWVIFSSIQLGAIFSTF